MSRMLREPSLDFSISVNLLIPPSREQIMNRRTNQTQRKMRIPNILRGRKKVVKPKETVVETTEASCQTTGCGCGQ